jgi:hypothetical protein
VWRRSCTRFEKQNLVPTVKYGGGGVVALGCMASNGVGKLVFVYGVMDSYKYCRILADNLKSSASNLELKSFIFQQDNDPKHTSKIIKEFLEHSGINLMEWPAHSPDFNPIEHLWSHIKRELKKYSIKNVSELKTKILEIWNDVPADITRKLVDSIPKRLEAVLKAKGGHSKY